MSAPAIRFHDAAPEETGLRRAVLQGLRGRPRTIPPKFFYDARGSQLFDAICRQPEYYPTRTEESILRRHAGEIAELAGTGTLLIELGSGASRKVRLLLEALRPATYMGVDISRDFLMAAARRLAGDYPWLDVHATCMDFSRGLALEHCPSGLPRLAFFPGSSIGNFEPSQAQALLGDLARVLGPGGALLIGVDLKKDPAVLDAAYNDAAGVTAEFSRNLLRRMRDELGARLDPEGFRHHAFYNEPRGRIEMHLVSRARQRIAIDGEQFELDAGETIHTENSYKYSVAEFTALAAGAGYRPAWVWTDPQALFSVHYLVAERPLGRTGPGA